MLALLLTHQLWPSSGDVRVAQLAQLAQVTRYQDGHWLIRLMPPQLRAARTFASSIDYPISLPFLFGSLCRI